MTLAVTGDAGKVLAMQLKLAKFGIVQLARTGKISLKRGRQVLRSSTPWILNDAQKLLALHSLTC